MVILDFLVASLLLAGAVFTFLGSFALIKLPDVFTRLHGPTKVGTLGAGLCLLASAVYFTSTRGTLSIEEIIVLFFLVLTAPISAHMIAQTAWNKLQEKKKQTPPDTPQ